VNSVNSRVKRNSGGYGNNSGSSGTLNRSVNSNRNYTRVNPAISNNRNTRSDAGFNSRSPRTLSPSPAISSHSRSVSSGSGTRSSSAHSQSGSSGSKSGSSRSKSSGRR
jgi:hypothetical protein